MTDKFVSAAELMARVLGAPDHRFVTIEHPISSATSDELDRAARAAVAHCVAVVRAEPTT